MLKNGDVRYVTAATIKTLRKVFARRLRLEAAITQT